MDDWLEQMTQALDKLASETEQWVEDTVTAVITVADEIADDLDANLSPILMPIQADLERNLDQLLDTVEHTLEQTVEPWVDQAMVNLGTWVEATTTPVNQVVDPWLQQRTRCIGCRNYHGQTYGDQDLICAIHPFGPDPSREACPDYEAVWEDINWDDING